MSDTPGVNLNPVSAAVWNLSARPGLDLPLLEHT